ncbi:hypothetical protein [Streptomyces sp. 8N616]|uniref:hypothetical protein n=1 Tax=Streptomyces sp. 8N616 TaxID=3457414 RepID=UPI003FCF8479
MPRPTAAQFAYGSVTVVFSTLAMLLLSQTRSGIGVAVIAFAGLALGLLVSATVPVPRTDRQAQPAAPAEERLDAVVPGPRARAISEPRVEEHSVHS